MIMIPQAETATVYRGGGRRYFSKRSACRAAARAKIKQRCDCETVDHGFMGVEQIACSYHSDMNRYEKMIRRLARVYAAAMGGLQHK